MWFKEAVNSKLSNTCVMGVDVLALHPEPLLLCPDFGVMCVMRCSQGSYANSKAI